MKGDVDCLKRAYNGGGEAVALVLFAALCVLFDVALVFCGWTGTGKRREAAVLRSPELNLRTTKRHVRWEYKT